MPKFRPQFSIPKRNPDYWDKKPYHSFSFDTYRELKRKLPAIMREHNVDEVTVSRSLRGEWGEWITKFTLNSKGKLVAREIGWM